MPLKMDIPFICYILLIVARNAVEIRLKPLSLEDNKEPKSGGFTLFLFILSYLVSAVFAGKLLLQSHDRNYVLIVLGAMVMALSYMGRMAAIREMGRSYGQYIAPKPEGNLVASGVFRVIRHPLYMFYTLEMSSFILIKFNMISVYAFLVVLSTSVFRAVQEEKLLVEKFGNDYQDYCRKTKRFIPFIY